MASRMLAVGSALSLFLASGAAADVLVLPSLPHAANNVIPFGAGTTAIPVHSGAHHQVFAGTLFGSQPVTISRIAFAPGANGSYSSSITIRLGYTNRVPGVSPPTGLDIPDMGGGGAPNAAGPMTEFYNNSAYAATFSGAGTSNFQMTFDGTPFVFDPTQGRNLLVEIVSATPVGTLDLSVSRAGASSESSRAYNTTRFTGASPGNALRTEFTFTVGGGSTCYPDCDGDHALNVNDFICFQAAFAAGTANADCDANSTLNVNDFICFQAAFAAGCSGL